MQFSKYEYTKSTPKNYLYPNPPHIMRTVVGMMAFAIIAISGTAYSLGVVSTSTESASAAGNEISMNVTSPVTSEKEFSAMIDGEISAQLAMNERK